MHEQVIERIKQSVSTNDQGCWIWKGPVDTHGYGALRMPGLPSPTQLAHRTSYEVFVGPIPAGMQIDHLCRVRPCVNPKHLEPVTPRENTLRSPIAAGARRAQQTSCKRGHEFTDSNTQRNAKGHRRCRECQRHWSRQFKARRASQSQQAK